MNQKWLRIVLSVVVLSGFLAVSLLFFLALSIVYFPQRSTQNMEHLLLLLEVRPLQARGLTLEEKEEKRREEEEEEEGEGEEEEEEEEEEGEEE